MAKAKTTNNKKVANIQPKLKQRQKILHRLKALFRVVNLTVISLFLYGYYLVWSVPFWKVEIIELNGLSKIGYEYLKKFEPEKSYKGRNILTLDSFLIGSRINNFRVFQSVNVYRTLFPAKLTFNFIERTPYLTIYDASHEKDITIDEEGIVLTFLKNNDQKAIYLIKKIKDYKITPEQMNVIRVIENLRNNKDIGDVGVFDITDTNNIILTTKENTVLLGTLEDLIMKIKSLPPLESLSKTNKNELEYIDVRYWRNPVLKLKKGSD